MLITQGYLSVDWVTDNQQALYVLQTLEEGELEKTAWKGEGEGLEQRRKQSDRQRHVCPNDWKDVQDIRDSCISYSSRTSNISALKRES